LHDVVRIFRGATCYRHFQQAIVVKGPRHHLDEFIVIPLADLFQLSAPIARIQVQSDLHKHERLGELAAQPPVPQ
jgi:hypothetical protein